MICRFGHDKHPGLFAPNQKRKAEQGLPAICMECDRQRQKKYRKRYPETDHALFRLGNNRLFLNY